MAPVLGIDISSYDSTNDWNSVRDQGVRFVFVKAAENTFADSRFTQNWQGAKSVGMYRGAYHFFHPENNNAVQQANAFIQAVGADQGELPPVLDLEPVLDANHKDISPKGNALLSQMKIWLDTVEAAFHRKPIIYTATSYVWSHGVNGASAPWLKDYPLWIAQYPWMSGTTTQYSDPATLPTPGGIPQQPSGFQPWIFWQYSSVGVLKAFQNSHIDLDYFNGSLDDLAKFAGSSVQPVTPHPTPVPTDTTQYVMQAGDTLAGVATKFNMNLSDLVNLNNAVLIQPGKSLTVNQSQPPTPPPPTPTPTKTYTVQKGDTLSAIAAKFNTTVSAIATANKITNPNIISVGQVLVIPS